MKNNYISYIVFVILILCASIFILKGCYRNYVLQNSPHTVVCAEIISATPYRNEIRANLVYYYNGEKYKIASTFDYLTITREKYNSYLAGNKNQKILISNSKPQVYSGLITENDYNRYNIQPVDTVGLNCSE